MSTWRLKAIKSHCHYLVFVQDRWNFRIQINFSQKAHSQLKPKFIWQICRTGKWKFIKNKLCHITNLAAKHIYDKNLRKSPSPEPKGRCPWNLLCSIRYSSTTKFIQTMAWSFYRKINLGWLLRLYENKLKQWISLKLWKSVILKLTYIVSSMNTERLKVIRDHGYYLIFVQVHWDFKMEIHFS